MAACVVPGAEAFATPRRAGVATVPPVGGFFVTLPVAGELPTMLFVAPWLPWAARVGA